MKLRKKTLFAVFGLTRVEPCQFCTNSPLPDITKMCEVWGADGTNGLINKAKILIKI